MKTFLSPLTHPKVRKWVPSSSSGAIVSSVTDPYSTTSGLLGTSGFHKGPVEVQVGHRCLEMETGDEKEKIKYRIGSWRTRISFSQRSIVTISGYSRKTGFECILFLFS